MDPPSQARNIHLLFISSATNDESSANTSSTFRVMGNGHTGRNYYLALNFVFKIYRGEGGKGKEIRKFW